MKALVKPEPSALQQLLSSSSRLKDIPVDTIERLVSLQCEQQADEARRVFAVAFNAVQSELAPVRKRGRNTQTGSFYVLNHDLVDMLDPIIIKHGFSRSISTEDCPTEGHLRFVLLLRHTGGHEERHRLDAPIDSEGPKGNPVKTKIHGMASSYTICEKHLLLKVFGVQAVKDDDGNAAGGLGPGAEKISEGQVLDLMALRDDVKADGKKFLSLFKIKTLADLSVSQYKEAVRVLEEKRK